MTLLPKDVPDQKPKLDAPTSLGAGLKGFSISTKFKGSSGHFRFDKFYILDFHSAYSQPGQIKLRKKG